MNRRLNLLILLRINSWLPLCFGLHFYTFLHSPSRSRSLALSLFLCLVHLTRCPCPFSYFYPLTIVNSTVVRCMFHQTIAVDSLCFALNLYISRWSCLCVCVCVRVLMAWKEVSLQFWNGNAFAGCLFHTSIQMVNRHVQCGLNNGAHTLHQQMLARTEIMTIMRAIIVLKFISWIGWTYRFAINFIHCICWFLFFGLFTFRRAISRCEVVLSWILACSKKGIHKRCALVFCFFGTRVKAITWKVAIYHEKWMQNSKNQPHGTFAMNYRYISERNIDAD